MNNLTSRGTTGPHEQRGSTISLAVELHNLTSRGTAQPHEPWGYTTWLTVGFHNLTSHGATQPHEVWTGSSDPRLLQLSAIWNPSVHKTTKCCLFCKATQGQDWGMPFSRSLGDGTVFLRSWQLLVWSENYPTFYWTPSETDEFMSHPYTLSLRSILILFSHVLLSGVPTCLIRSIIPLKYLWILRFFHPCYTSFPYFLLNFVTLIVRCEYHWLRSSLLCNCLHSPVSDIRTFSTVFIIIIF
jgi:hypothetical protein